MGIDMKSARFGVPFVLTLLILLPAFFSQGFVVTSVSANSNCQADTSPIEWNETLQRIAITPMSHSNTFYPWDDGYYYEDEYYPEPSYNQQNLDDSLHPEEPWMYNRWGGKPSLDTLRDSHYTSMQIGNDSAGVLKMNLSKDYRYVMCVSLQKIENNQTSDVSADVYLFTNSEYSKYEQAYTNAHSEDLWWEDFDESISDIPPEWRRYNPLGWSTFRDAHQYEDVESATITVALDKDPVSNTLFNGLQWQEFYLVIDNWDNGHDGDSEQSNSVIVADVTFVPVERSFVIPPMTVSLVFLSTFIAIMIVPFVLNKRYMSSGLEPEHVESDGIMPSLNQQPEINDVNFKQS